MSLQTRISDLATRIGTEFKAVRTEKANAVHTHTASDITDFDTEVSNNVSVTNNTAKISADGSIATHSDVDLTGLLNGNVLTWNNTLSRFEPSSPGGGGDLLSSNNLSDLSNVATARTNLGVYSTTETNTEITNAVAAIIDGAPATLDTLNELAAALQDNPNQITDILTALGNRVRFDAAQTLTGPQLIQAQSNMNVVDSSDIGNTDSNFVATFEAALV